MQLFGTDLLKTYWAHDVKMTSHRRHYDVMCLLGIWPPPNILNLPTPMLMREIIVGYLFAQADNPWYNYCLYQPRQKSQITARNISHTRSTLMMMVTNSYTVVCPSVREINDSLKVVYYHVIINTYLTHCIPVESSTV